jgi:hypothetical protein
MYITSWFKALFGPTDVFDLDPILNLILTGSRSRLRTPCNRPSLIIVVELAHFLIYSLPSLIIVVELAHF